MSVTSSGVGPLTFATVPAVDEFGTGVLVGGAATYPDCPSLDTVAQTMDATALPFFVALTSVAEASPATFAGGMRHNSQNQYLQSRPTTANTNAAGYMVATFVNNTGGSLPDFIVSYAFTAGAPLAADDCVGFRVFFSPSGAPASWVPIAGLDQNIVAGVHSGTVMPGGAVANGGTFYMLWIDDNDNGDTDPFYTIDNFAITLANQPPGITTQPAANTTVNERQVATLSVAASGSGLSYQWTKGGVPIAGATASTLIVTNIDETDVVDGRGNAKYAWSNPMDSGTYRVIVSGTAGAPVTSDPAVVTVTPDTIAPAMSYAVCGTSDTEFNLIMSEPLNDATAVVTDSANWEIKSTDDVDNLNVTGVAYLDNGVNQTITFTTQFARPATKGVKITLKPGVELEDTAKSPNKLTGPASKGVLCFTNELLALNAEWRYNDTGEDLGPTWYTGPDSTLPSVGPGIFHANRGGCTAGTTMVQGQTVGTCTTHSNTVTLHMRTNQYFRTHFNFSGTPGQVAFQLEDYVDDGAVVYLNGTELVRVRMPAGPVNNVTFGTTNPDGSTSNGEYLSHFFVPGSAPLNSGDNVIAASVHQINYGSSDITWGARVSVISVEPPVIAPTLTIAYNATLNEVTITSTVAGTLWSSANIETPRAMWTSEGAIGAGGPGRTLTATGPRKFFFVSVP